MPMKKWSLKCGFICLLLAALFLFIFYRCTMNAFLAVKTLNLEINSYEDVLESPVFVIVYRGSAAENNFKLAQPGTTLFEIYKQKVKNFPSYQDVGGLQPTLDLIKKGEAIYGGDLETLMAMDDYPCSIIDVKPVRYNVCLHCFARPTAFPSYFLIQVQISSVNPLRQRESVFHCFPKSNRKNERKRRVAPHQHHLQPQPQRVNSVWIQKGKYTHFFILSWIETNGLHFTCRPDLATLRPSFHSVV